MKEAKLVLHHDDPPCDRRLNKRGDCDHCQLHPDTQSTRLWAYCPDCKVPLDGLKCNNCNETFKMPN